MAKKKRGNPSSTARPPRENVPPREENATFEAACAKIQQNSKKHLERIKNIIGDDKDDEQQMPVEEETIIEKMTEAFQGDREETQDHLNKLLSDTLTCLICIESVRHTESTWSCPHCFQILHLDCVGKWAKDSLFLSLKLKSDSAVPTSWSCPNCRCQLSSIPQHYTCFCGKERNPKFDKWLCPHSCGALCGRELKFQCGHHCTLLCHPGPCPPCPKTVQASCFCGSCTITRRCSRKEWSCAGVCGRLLSCRLHKCPDNCHRGECSPCSKESVRKCNCGSSEQKTKCSVSRWKCDKVCGRRFDCKLHTCQEKCHAKNDCGKCPNAGLRYCPCGRTKHTDLSCTQTKVPTCLNTCEKLLSCGKHRCWNKCHYGVCENCSELVTKTCRCGTTTRPIQCLKSFTCEKKCGRSKPCGHICTRKCCPLNEDCPPCTLACNKKLNCRIHKCQSLCHNGPCFPCRTQKEKVCSCGKTSIKFPCGTDMQSAKVLCKEPCRNPSDCHHKNRPSHRCHSGRCPSCNLECGEKLCCGHRCPAKCHSAVMTKILPKEKPRGPWEPLPQVRWELMSKPCPPCRVKVFVDCLGAHGLTEWPCYLAKFASCGKPCGRVLPCGQHHCTLECHIVVDAENGSVAGTTCESSCGNGCQSKSRPQDCTHPCGKPCHAGDCPPCNRYVQVRCYCMNTLTVKACKEWCAMTERQRAPMLSCGQKCSKHLDCGHRCYLKCHPGNCGDSSQCRKLITLSCPCKRIKKELCCEGGASKSEKVKCDSECHRQQSEKQRIDNERKAADEARQRQQQHEQNALEVEKALGGRKLKHANRKMHDLECDDEGQKKLLESGVAKRVFAGMVFVLLAFCLKLYFDL